MSTNLGRGEFELALIAYNLSEVPDLKFMLSSRGKGNYSGYASEEMDTLLERVYSSEDETAFIAAMSDVQMRVVADLPVMGLFFRTGVLVSERSLGGLSGVRRVSAAARDTVRGVGSGEEETKRPASPAGGLFRRGLWTIP